MQSTSGASPRTQWWTRAKDGTVNFATSSRAELSYFPDVLITALIVVLGTFAALTSLDDASKLSIAILLATFNMVFLFGRSITRRLKALATDSLTVIPRESLCRVLHQHLSHQREILLNRAGKLSDRHGCELEKHEMYAELIGLTDVVAAYRSNTRAGTILAISSTNLEDFEEEPLAEAYLDANRNAVSQGVVVQRLFLIDSVQRDDRRVARLIEKHQKALGDAHGHQESGVRWLLKSHVGHAEQAQDFALFANEALITQGPGSSFELSQDQDKVERAASLFERLWRNNHASHVAALSQRRRT